MFNWLRTNVYAAGLMVILRFYLGYAWITGGWHKLTGGFDATGFLKGAVTKPVMDKATNELVYPTFTAFLENFALPNAKLFNVLIPLGEFLVGLGLVLGALTTAAAFFGVLMNFMFLFAGTVSTNPWMILLGVIVIAAGANAGKFGADYYILPYLRKLLRHRGDHGANPTLGGGKTRAHI
ncbi:DoxX family protein [Paenibacillus chitinolyticus]|uniref:DoxX family protein n=1 Tax=Paenibacillus chitinolyticus TaxID=79263 RepID=A0A410WW65_9BACL|nr:DoxX family protein [Paenibacillus chitinolyticus]MCY9593874.1 DoxX family protein [Paenibacillus chitinolyticus]MCY9597648.1 DoxX family protein [Paenibacillus chitinolyticus]QAV18635.1 DoxX family protein [Paenibacillus chitinolyticus]